MKTCCLRLKKEFGIFSRKLIIEYTQWNDGDKRLTENLESARVEGKLKQISIEETTSICMKHKGEDDMVWFKNMVISPSFKNPPSLFEWIGED
jgi:hypothetical protein